MNWKELLGVGNIEVVGLDIGSSAVKLVQLCKGKSDYMVTAAAMSVIEQPMDNERQKKTNTTAAIRECFKATTGKTSYAVCGLCGPDVMVRNFSFPPLPDEQMARAVLLEAEQVCPLDIKHSTIDYQIVSVPSHTEEGSEVSGRNAKGIFYLLSPYCMLKGLHCLKLRFPFLVF